MYVGAGGASASAMAANTALQYSTCNAPEYYRRERNGRSPTRKCEWVMCRASTQVYALVRIIECKKKKKKKKKKEEEKKVQCTL